MRRGLKELALVALLAEPMAAYAIPVTFVFEGTCQQECSDVGLSLGNRVFGSLVVDDAWLVGSENTEIQVSNINLISIDFVFGSVTFSASDIVGAGTTHFWYSSSIADGRMFVRNGGWLFADNGTSSMLFAGAAPLPNTNLFLYGTNIMATGAFLLADRTNVPEPGTLALLGLGLAGLGLSRRKKLN